ncbi:alpha/beta fold hydrolase [Pseudofrankia sp. BMG5.36]|uniref:alpha/beta hydrolase n=1 Tax=Pseudofrankia sp. BMG5.36 TaxID=1834512 RepID=UPI0008D97AEE|nr:lysophospholipase [Pseudofrankia sp. BMG5.36]
MPYYRDQLEWKGQQEFLPRRLRLEPNDEPAEEFWSWRGHRVHLDRYAKPDAPAKVVLHHGVGTNGRQMTLIAGAPLAKIGYETVALDNLGYGMTETAASTTWSYEDWVQVTLDFLVAEKERDPRPIFLYGLSAGGMLAFHVAAKAPKGLVAGIVGMTFMDMRNPSVMRAVAHDPVTGVVGVPALGALRRLGLGRVRLPMAMASKMSALANGKEVMKVLMRDRTSAANRVSLKFIDSLSTYTPAIPPEEFSACPILLTQPTEDRWSPFWMAETFLARITGVPVTVAQLENAGHLPFEDPGLRQMIEAIDTFVTANVPAAAGR